MSHPSSYQKPIEDNSLTALRSLIGATARYAFCPGLRDSVNAPEHLESVAFALPMGGGGVVVISAPEWDDTARFAINAVRITAERAPRPLWREKGSHSESNTFSHPWGGVQFGVGDPNPIRRILVHSKRESWSDDGETEWVEFDHALTFQRVDDSQFLLWVDDVSIAGEMVFCADDAGISEVLSESTTRLTLQ